MSLLLTGGLAWAQAAASLAGRVTDESGGLMPGVTVTATQTDTGFTRTVVTDQTGAWTMPNVPIGPYRLEVSLQGFRPYVQTGIVLQVGGTPTINAVLELGGVEETVTVDAAAPLVDVRSAGIGAVVEQERIVELPLQGREVTDLIVLAGSAVITGRPNAKNFQGGVQISVAGGSDAGIAYILDGAMHNDVSNAGGLPLPFPDAMEEFRVATSGLSAEAGMHAGASVQAVTKSGTNVFHGNFFEFLRDSQFNATHPYASVGPDGRRRSDGLRRHQFGGTQGGPLVRDRLFFFGGYQGTLLDVASSANVAYVPTAAMLAGDFTTFASPACNSGRQITLRGGFVNNRIDPAAFSPAALNLARRLPTTDDPCGETRYTEPNHRHEGQTVGRIDYQLSPGQTVFGRYMLTFHKAPSSFSQAGGNVLATHIAGINNYAQSLALGDTMVIGSNTVNALRFAFNRTTVDRRNSDFFGPSDLGINVFANSPTREMQLNVDGGFQISETRASQGTGENSAFQVSNDLTMVRGRHKISLGANAAHWTVNSRTFAQSNGDYGFNGQITGLGLADFLLGRVSDFQHASYIGVTFKHWYTGLYGHDAWRATDRVTVNAGLRWEPYTGMQIIDGAVTNFDRDKFRQGIKSTVFLNAPAGLLYPGDPGFPDGSSGFKKQWLNFAPRVGVAWDVLGNSRLSMRASYGINYEIPEGETWFRPAAAPPYGGLLILRDPSGRLDDPYAGVGGNPGALVTNRDSKFPPFGQLAAIDPNINSPRVQQWNVTVERQVGSDWGASVSYLGSYSDRLWGFEEVNPGVWLGTGSCTINGVAYPVCTVPGNLNERRALSLERPEEGRFIGSLQRFVDWSTQNYRGMRVSVQRRSVSGVSLNGNWTWGRCYGLQVVGGGSGGSASGRGGPYAKPDDPDYDRSHCAWDRTHLANVTAGYQTPQFTGVLGALASDWRASAIFGARSGKWLHVTTGQTHFTGIAGANRVNQVSDEVYGEKTLDRYLNSAAFAQPDPSTYGNMEANSIKGPGFWKVDLSVSRRFSPAGSHAVEVRAEAFNLFNTFNWGEPTLNLRAGNFGRIQSMEGDPRIMQFVLKYGF